MNVQDDHEVRNINGNLMLFYDYEFALLAHFRGNGQSPLQGGYVRIVYSFPVITNHGPLLGKHKEF